jgi:hypothetical protein
MQDTVPRIATVLLPEALSIEASSPVLNTIRISTHIARVIDCDRSGRVVRDIAMTCMPVDWRGILGKHQRGIVWLHPEKKILKWNGRIYSREMRGSTDAIK